MKLYHFSNLGANRLIPQKEAFNPLGEDSGITVPVIWFSDLPEIKTQKDQVFQYRYTVEVSDNDPSLGFDKGQQVAAQIFQLISDNEVPTWYYLTREIDIIETWEWNGTEYVKVSNKDGR